ncbi:DUF805 domain-containing protein [Ilumatobacter sp.]|uniref:DUF805 domain-containing protein n=1 Tax=Ilumatobacter sp. TaxID=1967498 RepID=UPI003AF77A4C
MDQFIAAYKDAVFTNYSNFAGRLDVGRFWRFIAINFVISLVLSVLWQSFGVLWYVLAGAYWVALFVPVLAATIRRLHDTGKTGWLVLLHLVPLIGTIVLIVLCVQKGDADANEYGPPYVPY